MTTAVTQNEERTRELVAWCRNALDTSATHFDAGLQIARGLGAHKRDGLCEVGFWAPELLDRRVPDGDIFLEVLEPEEPVDLTVSRQTLRMQRQLVPIGRCEAFCFAAVEGMRAGTRDEIGSFYALAWRDDEGWHRILDPLAASLPFGAFAPAEYYDVAAMQAERRDKEYFANLPEGDPVKLGPPVNILQIHVATATAGGTLASGKTTLNAISNGTADMGLLADVYTPGDLSTSALTSDLATVLQDEVSTFFGAGRCYYRHTQASSQLNGRQAHAATSSVNQDPLAGSGQTFKEERVVGRGVGYADSRSLAEARLVGEAEELALFANRFLGVGPGDALHHVDPFTHGGALIVRTYLEYDARAVSSRSVREVGQSSVSPGADIGVHGIDSGGFHPYSGFSGSGVGEFHFGNFHDLRVAELLDADGFHKLSLS